MKARVRITAAAFLDRGDRERMDWTYDPAWWARSSVAGASRSELVCGRTMTDRSAIRLRTYRAMLAMTAAATVMLLSVGTARAQFVTPLQNAVGSVYTADEIGNSISMINLATGQVTIVATKISPHNVQVTADGVRLLAVGDTVTAASEHGHSKTSPGMKAAGTLLVFSNASLGSGPSASLVVGDHPAHVVIENDAGRAFVTLSGENALALIDLKRNEIVLKIATGRYPHGLRISPDGRTVYVANVEDDSVSVIDTASLSEVAKIPVGKAPVQVGFTPDGMRAYVSLRDENKVAVIETKSRSVLARIDVGRNPIQVHATADGRFVYVANQGTTAEPSDTVSVIETATHKVVETIRTGAGAHGVAISTDGRFVFISNIFAGTVSVIDTEIRAVVATFKVGGGPNGITYRP